MNYLELTAANKKYIEKYFGEMTDDNAKEIAEELLEVNVDYAWISDDDTIAYELVEEEENDPDDVSREWSENYLNSLGMSMRDFY